MRASFRPRVLILTAMLAAAWLVCARADLTPADIYLQAADSLARDWRYDDAYDLYVQAERVGDGPQRVRAGIAVAGTAVRLALFELAYHKATALRAAYPSDPRVLSVYGQAAWSAGLFDAADEAFRDVLGAVPNDPRARLGMARVYASRNQLQDALDAALAAVGAAPQEADAYNVVGNIYKRLHRLDQAILWYAKYYSFLPERETDKRNWTMGEIRFLQSFGKRVPADIDARTLATVHTVPVRLVNEKVIVKGRVNQSYTIDFVLDTGAEQTVLSESTAKRLGVHPISNTISAGVGEIGLRGLQNAMLDSLQIGSLVVKNVPCLIKAPALRGLPGGESESFSPLALGLSAVVDYRRREVSIGQSLDTESQDVELPMWFTRLATVRGVVNSERSAPFIVDTGGEVISISAATARALPPQPGTRRIPLLVYGTSGWDRDAYLLPGVTVSFADALALRDFSAVVLNLHAPSVLLGYQVGGTVGHRFLSKYRVTFDLRRAVLGLSKN